VQCCFDACDCLCDPSYGFLLIPYTCTTNKFVNKNILLLIMKYIFLCACIFGRGIREGIHFEWWDNFGKVWANRSMNMHLHSIMKDCNWTGQALIKYMGEEDVSDLVVRDMYGNFTPAMPDDVFEYTDKLDELIDQCEAGTMRRFDISLCTKYGVNVVPLKIVRIPDTEHDLRRIIAKSPDGMSDMAPSGISPHNVSGNRGFLRLCRDLYESKGMKEGTATRYKVVISDMAIFFRFLKVPNSHCAVHMNACMPCYVCNVVKVFITCADVPLLVNIRMSHILFVVML
jgi:hypothetical protein